MAGVQKAVEAYGQDAYGSHGTGGGENPAGIQNFPPDKTGELQKQVNQIRNRDYQQRIEEYAKPIIANIFQNPMQYAACNQVGGQGSRAEKSEKDRIEGAEP